MKKKLLIICLMLVTVISLSGCTKEKEKKKESGETNSFGEYTGIYQLGDTVLKVVHIGDKAAFIMSEELEEVGNYNESIVEIKDNKAVGIDVELEFSKDSITVNDLSNLFENGEYKKISEYSIDDILEDYLSIEEYKDSEYNNAYELKDKMVYVVQLNNDSIRVKTTTDEYGMNLDMEKEGNNHFHKDLFDEKYDVTFNGDKLVLKVESEDDNVTAIAGTYTKKEHLSKEDIVSNFVIE